MNGKPPGWKGEPARHALAARGVKTTLKARGEAQKEYDDLAEHQKKVADAHMKYRNLSCAERLDNEYKNTIEDLKRVWEAYTSGDDDEAAEEFYDYGLSFDYIAPHTFGDEQEEGYFRYQLSWGGPSDEFRFYVGPGYEPYRIEYWFMDWFDGASRRMEGEDYRLLEVIFEWFNDAGVTEREYEQSKEY